MQMEWVGFLPAQCRESEVSTVPFVKQLGAVAGRELGAGPKGGDMDKWPTDLRIREFPAEPLVLLWSGSPRRATHPTHRHCG